MLHGAMALSSSGGRLASMSTRRDVRGIAWIGLPIWFALWFVVMQLLINWSGSVSTAASAGVISGVLMCAAQEWPFGRSEKQ